MKILVTGAAGFIGSKLSYELCNLGYEVIGVDNLAYDASFKMKKIRLKHFFGLEGTFNESKKYKSKDMPNFTLIVENVVSHKMEKIFEKEKFDKVINLAALAGVRGSIRSPFLYTHNNIDGFVSILECCAKYNVKHLIYASSSSVYGNNDNDKFNEDDNTDKQVSLYAVTKKCNELLAHAYSEMYGIKVSGMRFFTVYGEYGRCDMAPMLFAEAIHNGDKIKVFNNGDLIRDFTYIDDIVDGIIKITESKKRSKCEIYNIGCEEPIKLMDFISEMEKNMEKETEKEMMPMQMGDVYKTSSDISKIKRDLGYKPKVNLKEGMKRFIKWFKNYKKEW